MWCDGLAKCRAEKEADAKAGSDPGEESSGACSGGHKGSNKEVYEGFVIDDVVEEGQHSYREIRTSTTVIEAL